MNPNADAIFALLLKAEFDRIQEFLRILKQEQHFLIQGDVEQLQALATHKTGLIEKLAEFNNQRTQQISRAGFDNSASGIAAYLDSIKAQDATRKLWEKLLDIAREADQINRSNGILIDTHLRQNQQALSVLLNAAKPGTSLYGPNGQISGAAGGRRLDKA